MGTWKNSDSLFVKLGLAEGTSTEVGGEPKTYGDRRESIIEINLVDLNTSTQTILNDVELFPKNARIEEVEVEVVTAATSGGSATLDVGFVSNSDRTTEIDFNGLVAAAALTTINTAGKRLNLINGSTAAGALIGTTNATVGLFVAIAGTAVFTAGKLRIRVKWFAV